MSESVSMSTARTAINSLISFEKELLITFSEYGNEYGKYACEKSILNLQKVLNTLEKYKTVEMTEKVTA